MVRKKREKTIVKINKVRYDYWIQRAHCKPTVEKIVGNKFMDKALEYIVLPKLIDDPEKVKIDQKEETDDKFYYNRSAGGHGKNHWKERKVIRAIRNVVRFPQ